jgi:hypothetical protein
VTRRDEFLARGLKAETTRERPFDREGWDKFFSKEWLTEPEAVEGAWLDYDWQRRERTPLHSEETEDA